MNDLKATFSTEFSSESYNLLAMGRFRAMTLDFS